MTPTWIKTLLAAAGALVLAACGGGGGGGGGATPSPTPDPAPVITTQPASVSVVEGAAATFSVAASGNNLTYQWRRNGSTIAGAVSASYSIAPTTVADNGAQFSVVVANSGGSVTSNNATLTVTAAPARTAVGTATGPAASASIGAGGGSLTDGSGLITITVPANAFAAATSVSITPITDTTPGGLGYSYRIDWSGTAAQPIAVKIGRLADCRLGSAGVLIGVAEQRAVAGTSQGDWYRLRPAARAATGASDNCTASTAAIVEEITVNLAEPRVVSLYAALALKAPTADIAPNGSAAIAVAALCADPLAGTAPSASAPLPACVAADLPTSTARSATVAGGTTAAGTLANGASAASLTYTAPAAVTGLTPVELTATYATVGSASNVTVRATVTVVP